MSLWGQLRSWGSRLASAVGGAIGGSSSENGSTATRGTDTEFSAEVVRITQVLPHPNADRLEIAKFEMKGIGECAYEVVIQKGTAKPGDLMSYFSVDCVVPTAHPDFEFLTKRPDGAGKTHFRLRAARLRGVFSQGLLVPAPSGSEWGAQVAELYGVTYHRAEVETVGPTLPSAKPRPQPFPVYGVDSLKKMPRLFEEGEPVYITEKIHGCNFRFGWVRRRFLGIPCGWKFVVGSHRVIKGDRSKGWYGEDVWSEAAEKMDLARKTRDYRGYTFYGELYGYAYSGKPLQDLSYGRKPEDGPGLACFDVRTPDATWLRPFERECVLADCNLPGVPVYVAVKPFVLHTVTQMADGKSWINPKQIREGVVVESIEGQRRKAKYVGEGYLTRKEAA